MINLAITLFFDWLNGIILSFRNVSWNILSNILRFSILFERINGQVSHSCCFSNLINFRLNYCGRLSNKLSIDWSLIDNSWSISLFSLLHYQFCQNILFIDVFYFISINLGNIQLIDCNNRLNIVEIVIWIFNYILYDGFNLWGSHIINLLNINVFGLRDNTNSWKKLNICLLNFFLVIVYQKLILLQSFSGFNYHSILTINLSYNCLDCLYVVCVNFDIWVDVALQYLSLRHSLDDLSEAVGDNYSFSFWIFLFLIEEWLDIDRDWTALKNGWLSSCLIIHDNNLIFRCTGFVNIRNKLSIGHILNNDSRRLLTFQSRISTFHKLCSSCNCRIIYLSLNNFSRRKDLPRSHSCWGCFCFWNVNNFNWSRCLIEDWHYISCFIGWWFSKNWNNFDFVRIFNSGWLCNDMIGKHSICLFYLFYQCCGYLRWSQYCLIIGCCQFSTC